MGYAINGEGETRTLLLIKYLLNASMIERYSIKVRGQSSEVNIKLDIIVLHYVIQSNIHVHYNYVLF